MKNLLDNFASKKLGAFAAIVAGILNAGASPDVTVAGLVGALLVYTVPQSIVDRGKVLVKAALDASDK